MPEIYPETLRRLAGGIVADVAPKLEEAMPIIPEIRELDQMLMVSVHMSLASAHILSSGYMIEMIQGAAECFDSFHTAVMETAQNWEDTDRAISDNFKQ